VTDLGTEMRIAGLRKENARAWAEVERLRADQERLLAALKPFAGAVYYAVQDLSHYRLAYDTVRAVQREVDKP